MNTARPYPLTIEQDADGSYVVSDEVTLVYGWGATEDAALLDYDVSLQEWREIEAVSDTDDAIDLGSGVFIHWDSDGQGFLWKHPACRPWAFLRFMPDPHSTGHRLLSGGPDDTVHLTVEGSLLCPMGCGAHGWIRVGRWVQA